MPASIKRGVGTVVIGVDVAMAVDFVTEVEVDIVNQSECSHSTNAYREIQNQLVRRLLEFSQFLACLIILQSKIPTLEK